MADRSSDPVETMKANLLKNTGKSLADWARLVRAGGLEKHGDQMKLLKETHGLGHGYANLICHTAKGTMAAPEDDLLAGQFKGKDALIPVYEALAAFARTLGPDVEVSVKKTSVAFRRSKNFAVSTPASKSRLDLGLNLKGTPATGRLLEEKPGAMCTHKVKLDSPGDVDAEVKTWLKDAYGRA
ncbi:DUF5655 domain-containing protein [Hyphomonas sp.]|uniref:DUF5655 domain-containing protein n=1 Tax=Hyphomonas sp. TaxID=87 RepID=UPI001BCDB633|nr:DUF5655 domain-containing protein [Hyphomonas sp.]